MSRNRHYGRTVVSVDVDIDLDDVIPDLSDYDLRKECASRGISTGPAAAADREAWRDFADDIRAAIASGDRLHVEVLLIRMLALAGVPRLTIGEKAA